MAGKCTDPDGNSTPYKTKSFFKFVEIGDDENTKRMIEIDFSNVLRLQGLEGKQTYLDFTSVNLSLIDNTTVPPISLDVVKINDQNGGNKYTFGGIYLENITDKVSAQDFKIF